MSPQVALQASAARQHICEFIGFVNRKQRPDPERKKKSQKSEKNILAAGGGRVPVG